MSRRYSFTMLDTFEQCPFKWKEVYVNKVPRLPPTPQIVKGNVEHKEFEDVFALRREPTNLTRPYIAPFQELAKTRNVICEGEFGITKDGKAASNTGWNSGCYLFGKIDLCLVPAEAVPSKKASPQAGLWAHSGALSSDGTAYVGDWKTGKPGYAKPFQLDLYALLLFANFPLKINKVASRLIYTSHSTFYPESEWYIHTNYGGTLAPTWQSSALLEEVHRRTDEIERAEELNKFEKRPGPLCRFCPSTRCKESPNYVA